MCPITICFRILRSHGLPENSVRIVYSYVVIAKLFYASPAWWEFALECDKERIESFVRKSKRFGFCVPQTPSASEINAKQEAPLFRKIVADPQHVLHHLLPPVVSHSHCLRPRAITFLSLLRLQLLAIKI